MSHALSLIMLATEEAGSAHDSDKTFFYASGLLLAAWAVILSVIGLTRHDFPTSKGAARGVMAISAVLMMTVMAATVVTS